jgi:methylenetetrahydrofolate reductase (NADPH)
MPSSPRASAEALSQRIKVSFEFFPPKNGDMESQLWDSISKLAPFQPDFVSVTYGAGGSTKQPTLATIARIARETPLAPAAHLTCVGSDKASVDAVAREFQAVGVNHFVALRGDPPEGVGAAYRPHPDGYAECRPTGGRASSAIGDFDISVAAYPERHPESPDFATDIDMLKRKVDAGATRAITQFFFDNDGYERYRRARAARRASMSRSCPASCRSTISGRWRRFPSSAGGCKTHIPAWLAERFDGLENDPQTRALVAPRPLPPSRCSDLVDRGVRRFPLLHDEPGTACLCDLPLARIARQ